MGWPAIVLSAGNDGAHIAVTRSSINTSESKTRSTASDATALVNRTRSVSFVSAYARAISPSRAGYTLFTIIPIAVDRQSAPNGSFGAVGSRITRQRIARSGKIDV